MENQQTNLSQVFVKEKKRDKFYFAGLFIIFLIIIFLFGYFFISRRIFYNDSLSKYTSEQTVFYCHLFIGATSENYLNQSLSQELQAIFKSDFDFYQQIFLTVDDEIALMFNRHEGGFQPYLLIKTAHPFYLASQLKQQNQLLYTRIDNDVFILGQSKFEPVSQANIGYKDKAGFYRGSLGQVFFDSQAFKSIISQYGPENYQMISLIFDQYLPDKVFAKLVLKSNGWQIISYSGQFTDKRLEEFSDIYYQFQEQDQLISWIFDQLTISSQLPELENLQQQLIDKQNLVLNNSGWLIYDNQRSWLIIFDQPDQEQLIEQITDYLNVLKPKIVEKQLSDQTKIQEIQVNNLNFVQNNGILSYPKSQLALKQANQCLIFGIKSKIEAFDQLQFETSLAKAQNQAIIPSNYLKRPVFTSLGQNFVFHLSKKKLLNRLWISF